MKSNFKVGDEVVIISKYVKPYGEYGEIVKVVNISKVDINCKTSYKNENWYFNFDDVVHLDVYNSPLFKLLRESEE